MLRCYREDVNVLPEKEGVKVVEVLTGKEGGAVLPGEEGVGGINQEKKVLRSYYELKAVKVLPGRCKGNTGNRRY